MSLRRTVQAKALRSSIFIDISKPVCVRALHSTVSVSARPAPRPSPRVRDAQQASIRSAETAGERIDPKAALPLMKDLTKAQTDKRIDVKPALILAFLREWINEWNKHLKDGPWQKELCDVYSITPAILYAIWAIPILYSTPYRNNSQVALNFGLIRHAAQQDYPPAAMVNLQTRLVKKIEIPADSSFLRTVEKAAYAGDQQAMTFLAFILKRQKKKGEARKWLEKALGWPTINPRSTKSPPIHDSQKKDRSKGQSLATPGTSTSASETATETGHITADSLTLSFGGANDALRYLGQIYLELHAASTKPPSSSPPPTTTKNRNVRTPKTGSSRTIQPDYQALARTAFEIATSALTDGASYGHLLSILPPSDPTREVALLRAAGIGDEEAWKELAGRTTTPGTSEGAIEEQDDFADSIVAKTTEHKTGSGKVDEKEKWRQEWDVLLSEWEELENVENVK